jgi:hypothetical protein
MMGKIRARISSAHLIGVVALVFAVGTGLALANVPKNSVGTLKVKNGSLRGIDIRNNSLTGRDVRETTLNCGAIPNADCSADDAVEGPGPPGTPGGPVGPNSITSGALGAIVARVDATPTTVVGVDDDNAWVGAGTSSTASCASGEQLISGFLEWTTEAAGDELATVEVVPNLATNSVTVTGIHDDTSETYRAVALCLVA